MKTVLKKMRMIYGGDDYYINSVDDDDQTKYNEAMNKMITYRIHEAMRTRSPRTIEVH